METRIKMRNELQVGDVWYTYGGWHRVVRVDHQNPGNHEGQVRSLIVIQALTPKDGEQAWGMREWATGLRSDLAAVDPCKIRVEPPIPPLPPHCCWDYPQYVETDGALGHGYVCGICKVFLQAG